MPSFSIISPIYNAEKVLPILVDRIQKSICKITEDFEIILVDDCGPDNSWKLIEDIANTNHSVKGIKLSRNFGQHYAITAGLDNAKGDWVVVMDCDLQDQPEEIIKLFEKAKEGYDVVLARRLNRKDSRTKKLFSAMFYRTLGYLTGSQIDEKVANFGLYSSNIINAISHMREPIRYFPTMIKWAGFKTATIDVSHDISKIGKSNYNFKKLINLALDIILAYSDKPIRILLYVGLFISTSSFLFAIFTAIRWLKGEILVIGYTSLIVSIWFLSGIIISTLGIIGLYVGKIFEGVKNRPLYIVEKTTF